jgi:hypothetical protein
MSSREWVAALPWGPALHCVQRCAHLRRRGHEWVDAFVAGWSDAAIGAKKWSSLSS